MKTYAIGVEERTGHKLNKTYYINPCGSNCVLELDGRENIQKHMQSTIDCMSIRGYPNFVIIRLSSLRHHWQSHIIWEQVHKNYEIILD